MTDDPKPTLIRRYSTNEDGPWFDDLDDVIDEIWSDNYGIAPGMAYYTVNTRPMTAADIVSDWNIETFLSTLDDNMAEHFDDPVDAEFSHSPHVDDLKQAIHNWIERHPRLSPYWLFADDPVAVALTEEDVRQYLESRP